MFDWLRKQKVSCKDSLVRIPIDVSDYSFKEIFHYTFQGKKQLAISFINEESKECITICCEDAEKIIKERYIAGEPVIWELEEL